MASVRNLAVLLGGLASIGAGAIHFLAAGLHAEHPTLARLFVLLAAAQCVAGVIVLVSRWVVWAAPLVAVNAVAVIGWAVSRYAGIPGVDGLQVAEEPQFADSVCAGLGLAAIVAVGLGAMLRPSSVPPLRSALSASAVGALALAAMLGGAGHVHQHVQATSHQHAEATSHQHAEASGHDHSAGGHDHSTAWPRPFDPAKPLDISGVPGVSADQEQRARNLIQATERDLPQFSDANSIGALGFKSIGDGRSGYEHFVNLAYLRDEHFLDPNYPESLVYQVDGDRRTLVSAMYMAQGANLNDPNW